MISHNFRKLCNYTSVCYDNTTLSNCCFCIFLPKNYKLSKRTILKKDVWEKNNSESPQGIKTQTLKFCTPMPCH